MGLFAVLLECGFYGAVVFCLNMLFDLLIGGYAGMCGYAVNSVAFPFSFMWFVVCEFWCSLIVFAV